ncbi:MAG: hypothetical protein RR115_00940 [Hydrogenoanaerobacterium sp.]
MILYLHPQGKGKLLDELAVEENQYLKAICTDEIENFNTFVMYSQGNFLNSSLCIFYLEPQNLTAQQKEDLVKAINSFKCIYSARLVLILPNLQADSELMSSIMTTDIRNLITAVDDNEIIAECKVCFSDTGKEFADTAHLFAQEKINLAKEYIKPGISLPDKPFNFAIGGVMGRIGVTTQAIAVYRYLSWLGLQCCYIDADGRHIDSLSALYQKNISEGYLEIEDVNMQKTKMADEKYNAYILDYGVITEKNVAEFMICDASVLCCGTKAWELPNLADLLVQFDELQNALMLFSFTGDTERGGAIRLLEPITKQVFFAPHAPDIFRGKINTDFYNLLLLNKLQKKEG